MTALMVETALRTTLLALLVWLGIRVLRVRNAHIQKTLWLMVILSAFAMPYLMQWNIAALRPVASATADVISISGDRLVPGARWGWMLGSASMFGSAVLLLRFAVGLFRIVRVRARGQRVHKPWAAGVDVRICREIASPATFGSTILLPSDCLHWDPAKRAAVLAHERAHVRNFDSQIQWLAALHKAAFWFSPLSWWLPRHFAELAERTSDDAVLIEGADRAAYAEVLLGAACARPIAPFAPGMASGNVSKRIERILSSEPPVRSPEFWKRCAAVLFTLPLVALSATTSRLPEGQVMRLAQNETSEGRFGMDQNGPHIVSTPPREQLMAWYPKEAERNGVEGYVDVRVSLDPAGQLTDAVVVEESPQGVGFGAAATVLVRKFLYANPTQRATELTFRVKYDLDRPEASQTTTFEEVAPFP
jgi:TonB family protein